MSEEEANKLFAQMVSSSDQNTYPLLNEETRKNGKPDILIIIMESFANDIMPSVGTHKDVAVCLDSIARKGIFFPRFYSNTFRTDRGLVAVLSGYPAQPTTSIMRYPAKSAQLPSLARSLAKAKHYGNAYYYGGDVDFANQRSWLVSQGYERIISDSDFPIEDKLSKWGVHDHIVANRLLADIKKEQNAKQPMLRIFQTSSSHEPFDVPYSRLKDKRLNAFAYTDSVIGNLLREYSKLPRWKNTLVLLVADHVGAYKEHLDNFDRSRYQIPLIMTGGAIARPMNVKLIGSQQQGVIKSVVQLGIMNGYTDGTFHPIGNITLSEAIKMAAVVHATCNNQTISFSASDGGKWYDAYLNYCVKNRIVSSDEYSSLDAYATRAQIAHIFAKATSDFAVVNDIDYDYIPDVSERSEYADEILALYRAGILTGDERTRAFRPFDTITRAEAAAIISRVALPTTRIKIV